MITNSFSIANNLSPLEGDENWQIVPAIEIHDESACLVQYEAGGEGLDWQWSNMSVFYRSRSMGNQSQKERFYR